MSTLAAVVPRYMLLHYHVLEIRQPLEVSHAEPFLLAPTLKPSSFRMSGGEMN